MKLFKIYLTHADELTVAREYLCELRGIDMDHTTNLDPITETEAFLISLKFDVRLKDVTADYS